MQHLTKVYLSFDNNQFHLNTQNGVNLWSGRFTRLSMALEFVNAYMSNMPQTQLLHDEFLSEKFYSSKRINELWYLYGDDVFENLENYEE